MAALPPTVPPLLLLYEREGREGIGEEGNGNGGMELDGKGKEWRTREERGQRMKEIGI